LRVHVTGGKTYDVHHPDQIIVLRGRVDIGVGADPETGAAERVEHISLLHVIRVEESAPASSQQAGGGGPEAPETEAGP
jgi:hypothetical protein